MKGKLFLTSMGVGALLCQGFSQISLGQVDDFQDASVMFWSGAPDPYGPKNVSDGGPAGSGDRYLRISANGGFASGSRLAMYNGSQWAGNYSGAGVKVIEADMINFSAEPLVMRAVLFGVEGTRFTNTDSSAVTVPNDANWHHVSLVVTEQNMVSFLGTETFGQVASENVQLLLRHQNGPAEAYGTPIEGTMGFDNIKASSFVTIRPESVNTLQGVEFAGSLESLFKSDDDRYSILSDDTTLQGEIVVDGYSPVPNGSSMRFIVESAAGRPGLSLAVLFRNYITGGLNEMGGGVAPTADATLEVIVNSNLQRFISATSKAVQAKVIWSPINDEDPSQDGWLLALDAGYWRLDP